MTEQFFALVPVYGVYALALVVALSCLGLPVPSSLLMMLAGSMIASGDLSAVAVLGGTLAAALGADQLGYWVGRLSGSGLIDRFAGKPERRAVLDKARQFIERRGAWAVFLTRWLLSPLGPYVNIVGGAMAMNWPRFTLWAALGEIVWIGLYVGLGHAFSADILAAADLASNASGLIVAATLTALLGWRAWKAWR